MSLEAPPDQDILIFGVSGDLARRKLLPALYNLMLSGLLCPNGRIIGLARTPLDNESFRELAGASIAAFSRTSLREEAWRDFSRRLDFVRLDDDAFARVEALKTESRHLIYLAVPPKTVAELVDKLGGSGLARGAALVVEKPFGSDLASSRSLDETLHSAFDEAQIYRIDHYLGKETVQNILIFRFANSVFERVWNRDAIDHIQITVAESIGLEGRGAFYEEVGALRDIVQNHVLQMLALLTMESPGSFEPEVIREEKSKLLRAIPPVEASHAVRGQYTEGFVLGEAVSAYREEKGVRPDSNVETFSALSLSIDNWRWAGVPIYVRAGKRLPVRSTQVEVTFKDVPRQYLKDAGIERLNPNSLMLRVQPDEQIVFQLLAKVPGPDLTVKPVSMTFSYGDSFMVEPAEAYERLIHDAMDGNHTLFVRADAVELAWRIIQPLLDQPPPTCFYPAGSWGPIEAEKLIAPHTWHLRNESV